jgi:hypothetical protein
MPSSFLPLALPPGVLRSGNEFQSRGRWYDSNLVRWYDGVTLGPVLGWVNKSTTTVAGAARAIVTWRSDNGSRRAGIGTHSKLYVMGADGILSDITPVGFTAGRADAATLLGYGQGTYGAYAWGTPRTDTGNALPATVWDLDIWGQYLVGCTADDGKLYEYQNAGVATVIVNAPTGCQGLVVHPKRLLIALGAGGNPRKWQWSDLGTNTIWTPAAANQAGSNEIQQGKLVCARAVNDQVLMLSDLDAHAVDYIGLPFVLTARIVGNACGAISKGCMISSGSFCAWWSKSGFFIYDGAVRPLRCDVWDDLVRNLTVAQQSKVSGFHNSANSEFWWFYPRAGATENTHYAVWNYKYDHWTVGELVRTCGCAPFIFVNPFCVGSDGQVYEHELGFSYGGAEPLARSGPVQVGNGDRVMHVLGIVPDEKTAGDVNVSFRARQYPGGAETTVAETTLDSTGKADLRFSARQVEIVVTGERMTDWRWGEPRLKVAIGGKR